MTYRCNQNGLVTISDSPIAGASCVPIGGDTPRPNMTYVDPSLADYGDSPSGPNAPVIITGNERDENRDILTGMNPKKNKAANAAGCCPDGEANCWRCWLRDNWVGLAILLLSLAAFLTRKK